MYSLLGILAAGNVAKDFMAPFVVVLHILQDNLGGGEIVTRGESFFFNRDVCPPTTLQTKICIRRGLSLP